MKLIYIANARIPTQKANGYQVAKMCEEFALAGCQTELWLPGRQNDIKENLFDFYGLKKVFKVKQFKTIDFIKTNKFFGGFSFWLQSFGFMLRLLFVKADRECFIYTRQPEIAWLFSLKGYQVAYEAHRWPSNRTRLHIFLTRKVNKIIVLTKSLKELFVRSGYKDGRILIAPDGVDLKIFGLDLSKEAAREQLNLDREKIILGYTGSFKTMGQDKGLSDILKSIKIIAGDFPNIFFIAVGGSREDVKFYEEIAENLKIEDRVLLLERVSLGRLAVYQKASDILLMPFPKSDHYSYYMSPLKMFEYLAALRPIIASDLPSVREVLNENNSMLVLPDDPEDLARGIRAVLKSTQLADKLSRQARQSADKYTWANRAKAIINFIFENHGQ